MPAVDQMTDNCEYCFHQPPDNKKGEDQCHLDQQAADMVDALLATITKDTSHPTDAVSFYNKTMFEICRVQIAEVLAQ